MKSWEIRLSLTSSQVVANWKLTKLSGLAVNSLAVLLTRANLAKNIASVPTHIVSVTKSIQFQKSWLKQNKPRRINILELLAGCNDIVGTCLYKSYYGKSPECKFSAYKLRETHDWRFIYFVTLLTYVEVLFALHFEDFDFTVDVVDYVNKCKYLRHHNRDHEGANITI